MQKVDATKTKLGDLPISELTNIWLIRFKDKWISRALIENVSDGFYKTVAMRLCQAGVLEEYVIAGENTCVYRFIVKK